MSIKKTLLAVAAVGALTAATAVPASALENEFHGMYKMKYFVSNLDNGAGGFYAPTGKGTSTNNYFEQRARLFYNAKANDDLKLVVAFEIDSVFGDRAQGGFTGVNAAGNTGTVNTATATRGTGGAFDTDAVNLETKWVHLDFNIPGAPVNVKVGTQAIKDDLKGILFDVDAAGIYTTSKFGPATVNLGYFRGYEGINGDTTGVGFNKLGVNNLDMVILQGKFAVSKDLSVGADYYGYFDYRQNSAIMKDHTLAINADAKVGPVAVSGFIAGQMGDIKNNVAGTKQDLVGLAANVAGKLKVGPGTAKLSALYTSGDNGKGDNSSWQSLQQSIGGAATLNTTAGTLNTYNESGMMLLMRNGAAAGTTTDRGIVWTTNNKNQGVTGVFAGYDAALTPKFYANGNVGVAWTSNENSAKPTNLATNAKNSSDFLGTEINAECGYKLYDNLTASAQAAYVVLGDYYKNTGRDNGGAAATPDNPFTTRLVLTYVF
jgi:hypothetical protein